MMRDAEADIAEALSNEGWLTVLDGPLHGIRHRRGRRGRLAGCRASRRLCTGTRLALRAVREAVRGRNREGRTA